MKINFSKFFTLHKEGTLEFPAYALHYSHGFSFPNDETAETKRLKNTTLTEF